MKDRRAALRLSFFCKKIWRCFMAIQFHEKAREFHLYNKEVSYIMKIMENGQIENLYWNHHLKQYQ